MHDSQKSVPVSRVAPTVRELFVAFLKVGISGFGGVMPFAHRMLVDKEGWLDEGEFIDVLSLCQFLPGPNIVNMSIVVGRRFAGPRGAFAAASGLLLLPFSLIVTLGALYGELAHLPHVHDAFAGVAAGAAGLVLAMAVRMGRPLRGSAWQMALAVAAFVAIAVLRWPLGWVLLGLAPVAVLFATFESAQ